MTMHCIASQVEWLVQDEVLSRSRELVSEGEGVSPSLLQSVASHVQSSSGKYVNCLFNQEIIKFVFGAQNSMHQFLQVSKETIMCLYGVFLVWQFNELFAKIKWTFLCMFNGVWPQI